MAEKSVLVTNVMEYVGPPAVASLSGAGFRVYAHSHDFVEDRKRLAYQEANPGVIALEQTEPDTVIQAVWREAGRIDAIVSNDAFPAIHSPVEFARVSDLKNTLESLLVFPFELMQSAIPRLKAQGQGNVVFVTSCRTDLPMPGGAIPDMARAGANALVTSLSIELAPHGIAVNAIAPNFLYSEAYFPKKDFVDNPDGKAFIDTVVPAGRLGHPEEAGELVVHLATMKGGFHTGSIIKLSGGWPAAPTRPVSAQ